MSPVCENNVLDGLLVERDASKGELVGKGKSNELYSIITRTV